MRIISKYFVNSINLLFRSNFVQKYELQNTIIKNIFFQNGWNQNEPATNFISIEFIYIYTIYMYVMRQNSKLKNTENEKH